MYKLWVLILILVSVCSCNKIENGNSLSTADLNYIRSLHLLNNNETIYKFYSEYTFHGAGNFFTDKRLAKYWIDENDKSRNHIDYAFYDDIISIQEVYD